jgi:quercetin dioxygenase-like cupin family protein
MAHDVPAYTIAGKETVLATADARVMLMTLAVGQSIPAHSHTAVTDTTFCLSGLATITLFGPAGLSDPVERLRLTPGDRADVAPGRVHSLANSGTAPARLLLVQGSGPYDFKPAGA